MLVGGTAEVQKPFSAPNTYSSLHDSMALNLEQTTLNPTV